MNASEAGGATVPVDGEPTVDPSHAVASVKPIADRRRIRELPGSSIADDRFAFLFLNPNRGPIRPGEPLLHPKTGTVTAAEWAVFGPSRRDVRPVPASPVIAMRPPAPPCAPKGGRFRIAIRPCTATVFFASMAAHASGAVRAPSKRPRIGVRGGRRPE